MKKLLFALAAIALSAPAFAQQSANGGKFGLGIAIVPIDGGINRTVEVYAPIALQPNLRIEPSLGVSTADANGTSRSDVTLGAGLLFSQKVAAPLDLYFGGRLKLNFASEDFGATDDSGTDFSIAGAIGGEYYFVPKFSLGLEGQLGFYSNSDVSGDTSGFFTTGLGFLRMYF